MAAVKLCVVLDGSKAKSMIRWAALVFFAFAASACATLPSYNSRPAEASVVNKTAKSLVLSRQATRGLAFARARCSGCHAVTSGGLSPNPESPPFEAVVNATGLTRSTLTQFLRDSHNFPEVMNFTVAPAQIDDLADYMVTLRSPDYRPAI